MQLFYSNNRRSGIFTFDETESRHIIRVLRHETGDSIKVTDGMGSIYEATIIDGNFRQCKAEITGKIPSYRKHDYYLHIAIAPTKNQDRLEWFVEKAVEMGIDEISPLLCEHSERKKINLERLQKIALSAMKQSIKTHITRVNDIEDFKDFVTRPFDGKKFIAHISGGAEEKNSRLADVYFKNDKALFLIGPEGDFSMEEISLAVQNNFLPISLGSSRLRTETAGLTACCSVYMINQ
jgi:16S rRNA (uracil1498-N3)-methyltransferase